MEYLLDARDQGSVTLLDKNGDIFAWRGKQFEGSLRSETISPILKKAIISSISRMIVGPIIGFLLIYFFNLSGFAAGVLLIQCSMPSAVLNYLVASIYSPKKIIDSVASTIVVSTIMSFITVPIIVFIALKYFS